MWGQGQRVSPRLLDKVLDVGDFTMYPTDILKTQESIKPVFIPPSM